MRTVIFDFDGTIADSMGTVVAIAYELTKLEQLSSLEKVTWLKDNNVSLVKTIKSFNIPKRQWPWLLRRGRLMMAKQIHKVPLFPGMEEVLRELRREKYQLIIISTNSKSNVERFLVDKELQVYFDKIYGGAGLFDKAKIIKRVLKEEGLAPESAIYVGDEVRDIVASQQVNVPCVAVSWGYNNESLLVQYSPTAIARTPSQLLSFILEWGKTL